MSTLRLLNQVEGFVCPGCAWPEGERRHLAEFCENGVKAVAEAATKRRVTAAFFRDHPLADLRTRSGYWLGQQGRLMEPVYKRRGPTATPRSAGRRARPDRDRARGAAVAGRGGLLHLGTYEQRGGVRVPVFVRAYGTNNLPGCWKAGRRVVFVRPADLATHGSSRRAPAFRYVAYPTARGCAAAYFPETNVLVPLDSTAETSNTPTSKSVVVRLEAAAPAEAPLGLSPRRGGGRGAPRRGRSACRRRR